LPEALSVATIDGNEVKRDPAANSGRASNWTNPKQVLDWTFKIDKPGTYQVDIVSSETGSHGSPTWEGNHVMKVTSGSQEFETKIVADSKEVNQRSLYWKKIHTNGSKLTFDKPGTYHLNYR